VSAFRDRGVPGPTSENVAACPSPDGSARGRARRGEEGVREVEIPRPSCSSRAQVGCACSRGLQAFHAGGSERPHASASPVLFPTWPTLCKRALVLPFIGVRRGSRCTMGGVAECYVSSGGELEPGGRTAVGAVESLLTSSCFRKGAESHRRQRACGVPSLLVWRSELDGMPVLFPVA
jgi:hypothetical protein